MAATATAGQGRALCGELLQLMYSVMTLEQLFPIEVAILIGHYAATRPTVEEINCAAFTCKTGPSRYPWNARCEEQFTRRHAHMDIRQVYLLHGPNWYRMPRKELTRRRRTFEYCMKTYGQPRRGSAWWIGHWKAHNPTFLSFVSI